jgi:uncharacterized repeat protein (TIGR02543 family)
MNKPRLWAALFAALLLVAGCKDFFHPEGPTKAPPPPLTDEQAADAFREIETVKEALEINVAAIDLDVPADDLAALETTIDEALAAYDELPQGARSALAAEKARLDAAKEKIGHVRVASGFQNDHQELLQQTPEELVTAEEAAVLLPELNEALEAIEALSEGAQELLAEDKALLEDLKAKAEELTAPPVQHTITFDSHGGSVVKAITEDEGTAIPKPADPALDGHSFQGWFTAANGGALYAWPHSLTESITVHARWQEDSLPPPLQYTIIFDSHGGSELPPVTANEGTPVTKPADPTRTGGYRFLGWFNAASGGIEYTAWPYALTGDVTMHAQWIQQYTITFNSHEGSGVEAITADTEAKVPKPADPTRGGYGFDGWFPTASGGTKYDWPYAISADTTMHAQWTAITYTVQYNANGGGGTTAASAHTYDTAKDLTDNGFARTGYRFKEWAAAPNGSGAFYEDKANVVNLSSADGAVVDLYAQWTAIEYGIVYHLNEGKNDDANPETYTIASGEITLADPKRDGYDFGGWYDNGGFTGSAVTEIPAGSTEAKTFHARWTAIEYRIVYHLNGGNNDDANPETYTIASPAITLLAPTHATREFQDWYTDPGFNEADLATEIPAGSMGEQTFYARWKPLAPIDTTLLKPATDPALAEQVVVFEGSTDTFTAAGDYANHEWYWDSLISGQTGSTYTLTGEEKAGIHELSVVVVATGAGGKPLSARCKVIIIKAK